jgi:nitrite reductase (NADH) large subunit
MKRRLVITGFGMVADRFLEELRDHGLFEDYQVYVIGSEPYLPYDRVNLSRAITGGDPSALELADHQKYDNCTIISETKVLEINRASHQVLLSDGTWLAYDKLVLATGANARVFPIAGADQVPCIPYRTMADALAIKQLAQSSSAAVVIGGGLLGLELAGALNQVGLNVTVVELSDRVLPMQLDHKASQMVQKELESLGITIITGTTVSELRPGLARLDTGTEAKMDFVAMAAGVVPADELARSSGLQIGPRGGVTIDGEARTSDRDIYAIGDCAAINGYAFGLINPGYQMAKAAAASLAGSPFPITHIDTSTKLKLAGLEVAAFGTAGLPQSHELVLEDELSGIYAKLAFDGERRLLGGILVGDTSRYLTLRALMNSQVPVKDPLHNLLIDTKPQDLPDLPICSCNAVGKADLTATIQNCIRELDSPDIADIKRLTRAGTGCGSCVPVITKLLNEEKLRAGKEIKRGMCEHFDLTRQEFFDIVSVTGLTEFSEFLKRYGQGEGCDICKPTFASVVASITDRHPLEGSLATVQDTNDHVLANIQRNGSYSVIPRIPGGEITPDQLITIGTVAKEFDLYTKITGAQRIDMLGARVEQLPEIWRRLVEAGFESGHAYGKAVRTVKSCLGTSWCRYGVQDSVTMAIDLELRYRGLRSPHKLKFGVSGCARECAEARAKDVGVIATEKGWNLYVCGNGGYEPRHAQLLATDVDSATLIRLIDRFLIYYIRTADRLQRTAPWLDTLEGRIEHLRKVVVEDSLNLGAEMEAQMQAHVLRYQDEWAQAIADPEIVKHFNSYVNRPKDPDPDMNFDRRRNQRIPATTKEVERKGLGSGWIPVCHVEELAPERPVAALLESGDQLALVRLSDGSIHAIDNFDPVSKSHVLARGLVGSKRGRRVLISPMYKQSFDLASGECLENPEAKVRVYPVRITEQRVEVCL